MGRSKEPSLASKYFCPQPDCGEKFARLDGLRRHTKRVHEKTADLKYRCDAPQCGKEFRKRKQLYDHKYLVHDLVQMTKYGCSHCPASFSAPSKLKLHMKRHDGYKCVDCDFNGETWSALRRHKGQAHPTRHKCGYCDKEFSRWSLVKKHQRVHDMAIKCPHVDCEVELLPWRIARHVKIAHASSLPDGRQLRHIDDVVEFVLKDDSLPQKQHFECTSCGKTFAKARNLRLHERNVHSGSSEPTKKEPREARFACNVENCTKRFLVESKLQSHLNWHKGIKPLACPHVGCGARFAGRSGLQRHVKFRHMKPLHTYEAVAQLADLCGNLEGEAGHSDTDKTDKETDD